MLNQSKHGDKFNLDETAGWHVMDRGVPHWPVVLIWEKGNPLRVDEGAIVAVPDINAHFGDVFGGAARSVHYIADSLKAISDLCLNIVWKFMC